MTPPADILITNARVFTAHPAQPYAEAVAIRGNRITFVGSKAESNVWLGPDTQCIDGQMCTLMPGFNDSHFHLLLGSLKLDDIQLDEVSSMTDLTLVIDQYASGHPNREWLVGQGLRYAPLSNHTLTRHQLDLIVSNRPLIIISYDGHTAWANTEALRRANVLTGLPPVGPNSEIKRENDGTASGELVEPGAFNLVLRCVPVPGTAEKKALLRKGLANLASLGVTSVQNMDGNSEQMALYTSLEKDGDLTSRAIIPLHVEPDTPVEALAEAVEMQRTSTAMVHGGAVKFFMDGVIETYTGLLIDDYVGRPGDKGGALFSADHFEYMAVEADRRHLQIFVHAVGDGAVRRTLDGFEAAQRTNGRRDSRHRIEHIELIHPDDLPRFSQLGVIASMQPAHAMLTGDDPDPWLKRISTEHWNYSFAWQTIRSAGIRLAFGSDWPVASPNPILGLHHTLNRKPWTTGQTNQQQSLVDSLRSYTHDAAFAEFQELQKGQLVPGFLADLVLLSEDISAVPPEEILRVHPVVTITDGRVVFETSLS
jgi:predicted amidohydrolase YtcJ